MLKYKRTDVVVYFSHKELEYRRVDESWEVFLDGIWRLSKDYEVIESLYKKRTNLRQLIKKRDELSNNVVLSRVNEKNGRELSAIVKELIDTLGMGVYVSNSTQELLDKLDNGEIDIK